MAAEYAVADHNIPVMVGQCQVGQQQCSALGMQLPSQAVIAHLLTIDCMVLLCHTHGVAAPQHFGSADIGSCGLPLP